MKTIRRKLDEIGGDELNNRQKNQLKGGEEIENCYYCVCLNGVGEWVTKDTSKENAESKATKYCESMHATCGEVEMEQCWGIGDDNQ